MCIIPYVILKKKIQKKKYISYYYDIFEIDNQSHLNVIILTHCYNNDILLSIISLVLFLSLYYIISFKSSNFIFS